MTSVGRNSAGVYIANIVVLAAGYIPTYFFARSVGLSDAGRAVLGTYQLFLLLASTVNTVADLRLHYGYVYFASRGGDFKTQTATYFWLRIVLVAAGGGILWFLAPEIGLGQFLGLFGVWMTLPILWTFSLAYAQIQTIKGNAAIGQVPQVVETAVRTVGLLIVALANYRHPVLSNIVWEATAAFLAGALASAIYSMPIVLQSKSGFSGAIGLRMFRWELPMAGSFLLVQFSGYISQYIVVGVFGTAVFNVFSAANGFRAVLMVLPAAVTVPLFPRLTGLHRSESWEKHREVTWIAMRYVLMLVAPVAVGMAVFSPEILGTFYSPPYVEQVSTALSLLALSAIPASVTLVIGISLDSMGLRRRELYATIVQVALVVPTTLLLMRPYGIVHWSGPDAAATGVLASCVGGLVMNIIYLRRYAGMTLPWLTAGRVLVAILSFAVADRAAMLFNTPVTALILGLSIGFAGYAVLLGISNGLAWTDVKRIEYVFPAFRRWIHLVARFCLPGEIEEPVPPARHGMFRRVGDDGLPIGDG